MFFRKKENVKSIYVHQGNLSDKNLQEILERRDVREIVVTGSVILKKSYVHIPVPMTVMKNLCGRHICLESSLIVEGSCTAEMVTAGKNNNLVLGPGSQIGKLTGKVHLSIH